MSQEPRAVPVELHGARRKPDGPGPRRYWKSLDDLADAPAFLEFLHREFPEQASMFEDPKGRREFMTLMGASLALAGLTACTRQPEERILPYVRQPEQLVPGRPLFFATAASHDGYARGILVESHEGRPTKVEGNPDHPASLGGSDVFGQAHVLGLYDPDRSKTVLYVGEDRTWGDFRAALREALEKQKAKGGAGLRFLTGRVTSPTLAAQMAGILAAFPAAKWVSWEPAGRDNARAGAVLAFGEPVEPQYRLDRADVILSLEADFVSSHPASLRLVREFASRRKPGGEKPEMNRLYVVEGSPTSTGASADHRLALRSSEIEGFARAVAAGVGVGVEGGVAHDWVFPIVKDLKRAGARALVMAGESQPPAVHAIAHALNEALGAVGTTVTYTAPAESLPVGEAAALEALVREMQAGAVEVLVVLGANPAYAAPADLKVAEALDKVKLRIHHGLYLDETAERCHWHLPASHGLESWGDVRAADGTVSIVQPLIAPLYNTLSEIEVLALFGEGEAKGYDVVRTRFKAELGNLDFERRWNRALHDGVVAGTAFEAKAIRVARGDWAKARGTAAAGGLEIAFRTDPCVFDGRFANLGWLQELPRPLTKITWDNVALVSPRTAAALGGVATEQTARGHFTEVAELRLGGRTVRAPLWVLPGHADGAVTVHLGLGRSRAGQVGTGVGFDAYALRTSDALWAKGGLEVVKTGETARIACTQDHWTMEATAHEQAQERHVVRAVTLADLAKDKEAVQKMAEPLKPGLSMYPPHEYRGHAWGMAVDMSACVGCNACVTACQSENNIPVVGKDQVGRGREMHWIRVDRYYEGPPGSPDTYHQPVLCMHCENAPCEVVCPVAATVHSDEGLNEMVYNRCVGTRYCSNNCPYKVRRFNFLLYQDWDTETFKMMRNPEVTVRSRGVMEKCTYCVQRISRARIDARNQGRDMKDGDVVTACEAACPAQAIVFGDVNDAWSRVAKLKASERSYGLLTELQTKPRTTYLAAVRNPNPEIDGAGMASRPREHPVIGPGHTFATVTDKISSLVLSTKTPVGWFVGFGIAFSLLMMLLATVTWLLAKGVGIFGVNVPVGWGFDIINFVWWIGIGHAGTLISAILLLLRQQWRTSINRFAEAMTLFAVACAGLFPILHMGRPWVGAYWLMPYPNTMGLWPNFRSPLIWDVFAVSTYATVSLLFWFVGLIPDLATLRDRARHPVVKWTYGILAMGWRGSARHWANYETAYLILAGLSTPLVVSVHTVVSFDFAVGVVPGWHATIFPPYFVAGAIYAGFAMVLTLAIPLRKAYGLEDFITMKHVENMAKVMLATGLIVGYGYMIEAFMAWYSGNTYERFMMWNRMTGPMGWTYWMLILCNVVVINTLWVKRLRTNVVYLFLVSLVVSVGMWLERFVIIVTSLHRDFLPSSWGNYRGTPFDWSMFIGTMGLFLTLFFLFIRFLPAISIFEMRTLVPGAAPGEEQA